RTARHSRGDLVRDWQTAMARGVDASVDHPRSQYGSMIRPTRNASTSATRGYSTNPRRKLWTSGPGMLRPSIVLGVDEWEAGRGKHGTAPLNRQLDLLDRRRGGRHTLPLAV